MAKLTAKQGQEAFAIHQSVLTLKEQMGMAFVEMGRLLKKVRDGKHFETLGFDTFTSYVINSELGFKRRTAYYYIEIYEYFVEQLGYDMQAVAQIGYDKLLRALDAIKKLPESGKGEVASLINEVQVLRPVDFDKKYKDEAKQEGHKDYLAPPEYFRCSECDKWIIVIPVEDCCEKFLRKFYEQAKKKLSR